MGESHPAPHPEPSGAEPGDAPTRINLFEPVQGRLIAIAVANLCAGILAVVPYVAIVELARTLLPMINGAAVDEQRAWTIVAIAAAGLVLRFGLLLIAGLVGHLADNDLQFTVRRRVIDHLRWVPLGWFDSSASGEVAKAVQHDVSTLHQLIAHSIQDLTLAVVVPVVSVVYLVTIDWRMALAAVVPLLLVIAIYPLMMRDSRERYAQYDASLAQLTNAVTEYIHGISEVKTFGQNGRSYQRFAEQTRTFTRFYGDWMRSTAVLQTFIEVITAPIVILIYLVGVGALLVTGGSLPPVDLLPALLLGLGISAPYLQLGFTARYMRDAMKAHDSIVGILKIPRISHAESPASVQGSSVEFADVSFSYHDDHQALTSIVARCSPGTITALVGPSGSGKSTLARLIPRFYDATGGSVHIGGADVRDLSAATLYSQVGFVFQEPYLLHATIRDNIAVARPDADDSVVEQAARAAHIHDRIVALPRGYHSVIGEDAHLSGGEQQRIAIARGLVNDAPILILDEATAFADPDSEAAIQQAISELARERTVIVIAHRLHTITGVDQILVLDDGRIVETGTHSQLVSSGGLYQSLWQAYETTREVTEP